MFESKAARLTALMRILVMGSSKTSLVDMGNRWKTLMERRWEAMKKQQPTSGKTTRARAMILQMRAAFHRMEK